MSSFGWQVRFLGLRKKGIRGGYTITRELVKEG